MIFGKNSSGQNKKFKEQRLAFFSSVNTTESQESENWFPEEVVIGQNSLQGHIDQLGEELGGKKRRGRLKQVFAKFAGEKKLTKDEIELRKIACEVHLDSLKQPVNNEQQLEGGLRLIDGLNDTLTSLKGNNVDQIFVDDLLSSDMSSFYSPELQRQLEASRDAMVLHEKATNTLRSTGVDHPKYAKQARMEWKEREKGLKERMRKAKNGKSVDFEEIEQLRADLENKTNWINRRIAELQAEDELSIENRENSLYLQSGEAQKLDKGLKDLLQQQIKKGKKARIHRLTDKIEGKSIRKVNKMLGPDQRLELANIILEARKVKENAIRAYLNNEFKITKKAVGKLRSKKPECLNKKHADKANELVEFFHARFVQNPDLLKPGKTISYKTLNGKTATVETGPDAVRTLYRGIVNCRQSLSEIENTTNVVTSDPKELKVTLKAKLDEVKEVVAAFTPERIDKLREFSETRERERIESLEPNEKKKKYNQFGESKIFNKEQQVLLSIGSDEYHGQIKEIEKQFETLDEMHPQELIDLKSSLEQLHKSLSPFSGGKMDMSLGVEAKTNLYLASEALSVVRNDLSLSKLEEVLGSHLVKLTGDEFDERGFNKHTSGAMVFYERGNEWKIFVNLERIENDTDFKEQMEHELLHLQFENNESLKSLWLEVFTSNEQWEDIKSAFKKKNPDEKAPDGKGWKTADILSEIYAMQNDVFEDNEGSTELQRAILGAGITAEALGLPKSSIRGFQDDKPAQEILSNAPEGEISKNNSGGGEKNGGGPAEVNLETINDHDKEISRMLNSEYIGLIPSGAELLRVMRGYNNSTKELNDALSETQSNYLADIVKERIEKVGDDLKKVNTAMAEAGENVHNKKINPVRDLWNRSAFLSIDSFIQFGADIKEWMERRHKRRVADHAARIGSSLFDKMPIPILSEFGTEAEARSEKAQAEEVDEWKNRLSNKDAWELQGLIDKMAGEMDPNRDQLKAILRILAEKGRIDWRNENLWKVLTLLQNSSQLVPGDKTLLKNPTLLRQKLHQALGEIFDYDEFLELERNNESNFESGKQKYNPILDKIQDQLSERLDQLLRKHRNNERVDPQEYESIIEYCIKNGKSSAEHVMYHLIMGQALGLLPPDRGLVLDKNLNQWPATQWIFAASPPYTQADYLQIAQKNFKDSFKNGTTGNDFKSFYWTVIQNEEMVIQRVRKSVSERAWDHDWGRSIACMGDANTAKRFLSGRSGQQEAKDTAVENAYVGALQWLEANAKDPKKIDFRKEFIRQIAWISMADGIIDYVAYDRGSSDINSRANASMLAAKPREAGVGNHGDWTLGDHRGKIRNFLDLFDKPFFSMLRDQARSKDKTKKEELTQDIKDHLIRHYPSLAEEMESVTDLDHIFDKLDLIIEAIVNSKSDGELLRTITWLRHDLKGDDT